MKTIFVGMRKGDRMTNELATRILTGDVLGTSEQTHEAIKMAVKALSLPSAEPEIIHCRDCEFTDGDGPNADGRYWCVLHGGFMYFCSDAERRTDR